jgi:hypothetical protein
LQANSPFRHDYTAKLAACQAVIRLQKCSIMPSWAD